MLILSAVFNYISELASNCIGFVYNNDGLIQDFKGMWCDVSNIITEGACVHKCWSNLIFIKLFIPMKNNYMLEE